MAVITHLPAEWVRMCLPLRASIQLNSYFLLFFNRLKMSVSIKSAAEIEKMRVAGRLAAEVLEMIEPLVRVGDNHRRAGQDLPRLHHQNPEGDSRPP